ncbi:MAG: exosortase/archaeosortase family protein [Thermoproteota archaeon]
MKNIQEGFWRVITEAKGNLRFWVRFSVIVSFLVAFVWLYVLHPVSFGATWQGRSYYLFFLWLAVLEWVWEGSSDTQLTGKSRLRVVVFAVTLTLPMVYVFVSNYLGLNAAVVNYFLSALYGGDRGYLWWAEQMPLTIEYLVFGGLWLVINWVAYGRRKLGEFSISASLLVIVGVVYLMDNLYPNGGFLVFQFPVLATATLASLVLNILGYATVVTPVTSGRYGNMPQLTVIQPRVSFNIAWPCAGVESLLIYTVTILLFLKKTGIPFKRKAIYFALGGVVTYFINILRIVSIYLIAINGGNVDAFHNYYGPLYSIIWIITYPLIIIGIQNLQRKKGYTQGKSTEFTG